MIPLSREVMLSSGEALTAEEIFEGLCRLARNESAFPLLTESDQIKAVISTAVEALEFGQEREIL